jgi:hypothetical protein
VRHYIVVDRRDRHHFASLAGDRTVVLTKEEILPKRMFQLPRFNRWISTATIIPIHGWLVQQIAKIAMASVLSESTLLMVDSDAIFVRDVDPQVFSRNGQTRLYTQRAAIDSGMPAHVEWHHNACALLGIAEEALPLNDYIGQVISWNRELVLGMCERVENVSGRRWHDAIARTRQFSEYLLYGLYAERVAGVAGNAWIDENPRCNSHWPTTPLTDTDIAGFVGSIAGEDVAMMISTHSATSRETRARAVALATGGRVVLEDSFLSA